MKIIFQIIIAFGIYNVWLLRAGKATSWRGGDAENMAAEFAVYGLSEGVMKVVRGLKLSLATLLLLGIWLPALVSPVALAMAGLMVGAVGMHVKVKDPLIRSLPAFTLLTLSLSLFLIS